MEKFKQQIKDMLLDMGAGDVGFFKTDENVGGFTNGISIAVPLSEAIIDEITDKPTHTYFNHYRTVNAFIDSLLLKTGLFLQRNGYKYITVAASQSINDEGWLYKGRFSHKKGACLAGMGSMGNNCLFLHKKYGAMVRLGTVFCDCDFGSEDYEETDLCTNCNICAKVCPAKAISGKKHSLNRDEFFNPAKCSEHMKREYKNIGRGAVCGLCIKYCPYGKEF